MKFWQYLLTKLHDNQKVYVLTVIENFGSSPGRKGFKMLVAEDGFIFGSVGGGVMEFSLVEEAKTLLKENISRNFIKKQIHKGNIKDGSGMICSGEQTVAFHCLNSSHISSIEELFSCLKNGEKGSLLLSPKSFYFSHKILENQFEYQIKSTEDWFFEESIGFQNTLYIIGAGHVGLALSEIAQKLKFTIVLLDNRTNLNTFKQNSFAHKKEVVDYSKIENYIKENSNNFIVIMTNKYTDDKLVLSKLIRNNYNYLGVLGSKAKLKTMWEVLLKEGFTEEELDKVKAPIGLQIKSETPEEIAISILAELIRIKNSKI